MLRFTRGRAYRTSRASGWTQPHLVNTDTIYGPPRELTTDPRMAKRRGESPYAHAERLVTECTFEARDPDDKVFGGSHAASKAAAMNELKHFDKRMATPFHPELAMNVLKCASFYSAPNGKLFNNDHLEGRIVGLCLSSETARCMQFLKVLSQFTKEHEGDFVPIVISMAKDEMEREAHSHGLNYLPHVRGAALVKRDLGHNTGRWLPMPRLVIVEGSTGFVITHSGFTALRVKPETCFASWINAQSGVALTDYPLGWFSM